MAGFAASFWRRRWRVPHARVAIGLILFLSAAGSAAAIAAPAPATSSAAPNTASAQVMATSATFWPASGARDVCPDTPLRITFPAPPMLSRRGKIAIYEASGKGIVETIDSSAPAASQSIGGVPDFNYFPLVVRGNDLLIYPRSGALAYGKSYSIVMDDGVVQDQSGAPVVATPADWHFSTKAAPPPAGASPITVSAGGDGDFCTVQGAIDSLPAGNTAPVTIFIRRGIYRELICFTAKDHITLQGQDRAGTIIEYPNNSRFNGSNAGHVYHRGVLLANRCNDLVLENLTIHNTTPRGGSQAEAIIFNGTPTARAIVRDVDLYSYQDTLQINGQAYVSNCSIYGDVDFMWGTGPCFFENCLCRQLRSKAFYTQIRNTDRNHGYVYYHCTFDGAPGIKDSYLSRIAPARFPDSEVVLIGCVLTDAVDPVGWLLNGPKGESTAELAKSAGRLHFWEFQSHTADGQPADVSKRLAVSRQLTLPQDAGTIDNYSNPAFVLGGGWNPRESAISATEPAR